MIDDERIPGITDYKHRLSISVLPDDRFVFPKSSPKPPQNSGIKEKIPHNWQFFFIKFNKDTILYYFTGQASTHMT